jgi:hypothetical protein
VSFILRVDDLAHRLHVPRWFQRHLCDWLDISCGITRDELRREAAGYAALAASQTPEEATEQRARARRRRPPWADED